MSVGTEGGPPEYDPQYQRLSLLEETGNRFGIEFARCGAATLNLGPITMAYIAGTRQASECRLSGDSQHEHDVAVVNQLDPARAQWKVLERCAGRAIFSHSVTIPPFGKRPVIPEDQAANDAYARLVLGDTNFTPEATAEAIDWLINPS